MLRFRCVIHFRTRTGGYSVKTCLIHDFSESRTNKEISNMAVFEPLVVAGLDFELCKRSKLKKRPLSTTVNVLIDHNRITSRPAQLGKSLKYNPAISFYFLSPGPQKQTRAATVAIRNRVIGSCQCGKGDASHYR